MLHMAGEQIFRLLMDGREAKEATNRILLGEICLKKIFFGFGTKLHELHSAHAGCRYNVIRSLSYLYSRRNELLLFFRRCCASSLNPSLSYKCSLRDRFRYSVVAIYIY